MRRRSFGGSPSTRGRVARRLAAGCAALVGLSLTAVSAAEIDESGRESAAQRGDRLWPTRETIQTRVNDAFSLFGPVAVEARDEAATRNGRTSADTVPMPPPSVVMTDPAAVVLPTIEPKGRFEAPLVGMAGEIEQAATSGMAGMSGMVGDSAIASLPEAAYAVPRARPIEAIERAMGTTIAVPLPRRRPSPPVAIAVDGEGAAEEPAPEARVAMLAPVAPSPSSARQEASEAPILAEAGLGEPRRIPKEALPYLSILRREAAANRVPLWLAIGVGWVESKYNPRLRGSHGVVGIMQVMPSTARFQGYKGSTEQLLEAETNIVWGMRELGWDWGKAGGNPCLAIAKYKGGIATKTISSAAASYCAAAKRVTGMM